MSNFPVKVNTMNSRHGIAWNFFGPKKISSVKFLPSCVDLSNTADAPSIFYVCNKDIHFEEIIVSLGCKADSADCFNHGCSDPIIML